MAGLAISTMAARHRSSTLATVYRGWLASHLDLSPKVRRGYEENWRSRIEPRFGSWHVARIDHQSIQGWVNEMAASGRSPCTVRWVHSVLKMTLAYAIEDGQLLAKSRLEDEVPSPSHDDPHLPDHLRSRGAGGRVRSARRRSPAARLQRHAFWRTRPTASRRRGPQRAQDPGAPLDHPSRRQAHRGKSEERCRASVDTHPSALRAALRLLQKTMGHASITMTAHIYADLYDDELDIVASALDALDDNPFE